MSSRLTQQTEPLPGYRLIERLGRGGYGEVWKAEAPGGLFKAIKFVYGDLESSADDNKAAAQELRALNRVKTIRHPFILSIERFDIVEGQLLIVMELADRNLWDRFQECRSQGLSGIPREELLRYMEESSEALDLMNLQYQIQHLDIKPHNLFLVHNHVKVADFGLAKDFEGMRATITGGVTPVYAAPETFEGWISRQCDQYSLAIVYQELLTGVRPFSGVNSRQLLLQHISAAPDLSALPKTEWEIVGRALAKNPNDRFGSCGEFIRALREAPNAPVVSAATPAEAVADPAKTLPNFRAISPSPASPVIEKKKSDVAAPIAVAELKANQPIALKGLPALVTPGAVAVASAPRATASTPLSPVRVTLQRPVALDTGHLSKLGVAPPEKIGSGILFPVYVVGIGGAGLQVLQRLRAQVYERFAVKNLPHWKWLYIDTDPDTVSAAAAAEFESNLEGSETYLARMHRPAHYVKREGLPAPDTWMSTEMLYRIPREPATDGVRCLGRLALCDHFLSISQRIRQDLEAFLTDDALMEADRQTNLGIRTNRPRVYLAASIAGGTGSGMLIDLAYIIRNEMRMMGYLKPQLTGLLLTPPIDRSTPKNLALANACAALAELNYCSQPGNRFEARFDVRQATLADPDRPFERCVLLSLPRASSNRQPPAAASRAAGLICQEALTPVGRRMDEEREKYQKRCPPASMPMQSFGCYRISWPRQRLLETAAVRLAGFTVKHWCGKDVGPIREEVAAWFEDEWRRRQLDPESLASAVQVSLTTALGQTPDDLIEAEIRSKLTDASGRSDLTETVAAIDRILKLVGNPSKGEETPSGQLQTTLEDAVKSVARQTEIKFAKMAVHFIEQPGRRLAAAEEAIRLGQVRLQSQINEHGRQLQLLAEEAAETYGRITPLIGSLSSSGPLRIAPRRGQSAAELISLVRSWSKKQVEFLLCRTVASIYRQMLGNAPGYLREVTFCRQQLGELAGTLMKQAVAQAEAGTHQDHPIMIAGCKNLLENADRIIEQIPVDEFRQFEEGVQQQIRRRSRALLNMCLAMSDQGPRLQQMLIEQARTLIDARLGRRSAAEELFANRPDEQSIQREIFSAYDESAPEPFGPIPRNEGQSFVLGIAADEYGQRLQEIVHELLPDANLSVAVSNEEIVMYREFHDVSFDDIPQAGVLGVDALRDARNRLRIEPYSRTDVHWPGQ